MAIVYRLESKRDKLNNEVNTGAYHGMMLGDDCDGYVASVQSSGGVKAYRKTHPGPVNDPKLSEFRVRGCHVFCCDSIESLHTWFCSIDSAGDDVLCQLQIGVYDVPEEHCFIGTFQAVADRNYMKRIDTWEPTRRG